MVTRSILFLVLALIFGQMIYRFKMQLLPATILGGLLALSGQWKAIWPLFGSSNQMIGAIALLAVTMWLVRRKAASWFVQIPLYFMFAVTLTALVTLCKTNFTDGKYVLGGIAVFLLAVTGVLIVEAVRSLIRMKSEK